jgi:hypothetical protein
MREEVTRDIPKLPEDENIILIYPFMYEEVFEALSEMEDSKTPGADRFPAELYRKFRNVLKTYCMELFTQL